VLRSNLQYHSAEWRSGHKVTPPRDPNDHKYWRDKAAELRAKAETYENEFAAHAVRRIADKYDQMADHAEERIIHGIDAPTPPGVRK
jgi:hypothetical protein